MAGAALYRLRGEVGGQVRAFGVVEGDNWMGSMAGNAIVLGVRGVSRRHALLKLEGEGLVLEDLGSKNGTLVNGVRIQRTQLRPGDELVVGPVTLRVERVEPGDAELAIAVEGGTVLPPSLPPHQTTAVASIEASRYGLAGLEDLLGRLRGRGTEGLAGALAVVGRDTGARGLCLVVPERDELVVLAEWGEVPSVTEHERLLETVPPDGSLKPLATAPGEPPLRFAAGPGPEGAPLVLCLSGDLPRTSDTERYLRLVLAILALALGRPPGAAPAAPPASPVRLVFPPGFVGGESAAMARLFAEMQPLVGGDLPVLLLGETGVGKEGLAKVIHLSSPRHRGPFVAINCAAIPADLLEAEMFGIGKGVATGVGERKGKFQLAEGGTLFLDEIGDMPLALQAKLLRALQEKEIQPVGGPTVRVDIRVVAATNSDLARRMDEQLFRRDLYYRVAGFTLRVPPLRERREDILALVQAFLTRFGTEAGRHILGMTKAAFDRIKDHSWPGNVRELEHEMRRLCYLCPAGQAIDSTLLSVELVSRAESPAVPVALGAAPSVGPDDLDLETHVERTEREIIRRALELAGGNRTQAAKLLRISRNGLAIKMERLGLRDD